MSSQSADRDAPDQSPAPVGMRELPQQPAIPAIPAMPAMPAFPAAAAAPPVQPDDEAGPGPADSVIARDDRFEGTFTSRGTVRVEGSVSGRIEAVRVRIEEGARVEADVIVDEAIIAGEFTGNLTCRERLEARSTGQISGHVETFKLMLHEGASVEGEMHMLPDPAAEASGTIRGSAPVRGDVKPRKATQEPTAPATRRSTKPASNASTPRAATKPASASTGIGTTPESTPRPEATAARVPAATEPLRVTPRTATPVASSPNGSKSDGNVSQL